MERSHWDRVSQDDPRTMVRHGDWQQAAAHDFGHLPIVDHGPVLDLGCGLGRLAVLYAAFYNVSVIGVDISPRMLDRAYRHEQVRYLPCDGRALPKLPKLAAAWSMLMFQHIPPLAQESYVLQVAERLAPGAPFCFQTVIGNERTFLSYQVEEHWPEQWCQRAGLTVEAVEDGVEPGWLWVSARRVVDNADPSA